MEEKRKKIISFEIKDETEVAIELEEGLEAKVDMDEGKLIVKVSRFDVATEVDGHVKHVREAFNHIEARSKYD